MGEPATRALSCPACGYNLTGLPENRCPECGSAFDPRELMRAALRRRRVKYVPLIIELVVFSIVLSSPRVPQVAGRFGLSSYVAFSLIWCVAMVLNAVCVAAYVSRVRHPSARKDVFLLVVYTAVAIVIQYAIWLVAKDLCPHW